MQRSVVPSIVSRHGEQKVSALAARYAESIKLSAGTVSLVRFRRAGFVQVRGMAMPRRVKGGKGPSYGGELGDETEEAKVR